MPEEEERKGRLFSQEYSVGGRIERLTFEISSGVIEPGISCLFAKTNKLAPNNLYTYLSSVKVLYSKEMERMYLFL